MKIEYWKCGLSTIFEVDCENIDELKAELYRLYPGEEINIDGYNGFRFITNREHIISAGYPITEFDDNMLNEPAHFNPPFFRIMEQ